MHKNARITSAELLPAAQAKAATMMVDVALDQLCEVHAINPATIRKALENAFMEGALWLRNAEKEHA